VKLSFLKRDDTQYLNQLLNYYAFSTTFIAA